MTRPDQTIRPFINLSPDPEPELWSGLGWAVLLILATVGAVVSVL